MGGYDEWFYQDLITKPMVLHIPAGVLHGPLNFKRSMDR